MEMEYWDGWKVGRKESGYGWIWIWIHGGGKVRAATYEIHRSKITEKTCGSSLYILYFNLLYIYVTYQLGLARLERG